MNTYYCTHCGKKNAIVGEEAPVEPAHEHRWFLTARIADGTEVHDCGCGERKRIRHSTSGDVTIMDNEQYEVGSVSRALYNR